MHVKVKSSIRCTSERQISSYEVLSVYCKPLTKVTFFARHLQNLRRKLTSLKTNMCQQLAPTITIGSLYKIITSYAKTEKFHLSTGRQMYFYYLEWLFVYNQNKYGYM